MGEKKGGGGGRQSSNSRCLGSLTEGTDVILLFV